MLSSQRTPDKTKTSETEGPRHGGPSLHPSLGAGRWWGMGGARFSLLLPDLSSNSIPSPGHVLSELRTSVT